MIVNKAMLAPLARLTAVNANRAVRALKKENKRPFPFRAGLIRDREHVTRQRWRQLGDVWQHDGAIRT